MTAGKPDQESLQADTLSKTCQICHKLKPITNFRGKGKSRDGLKTYRHNICRNCERNQRRESGLCTTCGQPAAKNRKQCQKCLTIGLRSVKKRHQEDKAKAFSHYGQKCNYCGESKEFFLTIDHLNNDGAKHRKRLRAGNNGGHNIYAWLRKNNYPEGFQTLCYNCNCAKHNLGEKELLNLLKVAPNPN